MPGIADAETIGRLVKQVGAPVNVVAALAGTPMSVNQPEDLVVKRVSIGGSLTRATFGCIGRAVAEIRDHGIFGYAEAQVPGSELCQFFAARRNQRLSDRLASNALYGLVQPSPSGFRVLDCRQNGRP